jgi:FRG domain
MLPSPLQFVYFTTPNKEKEFSCRSNVISAVDRDALLVVPWEQIAKKFPEVTFPHWADITGSWDNENLTVSWVTNIGSRGHCVLPRSKASEPSELHANAFTWVQFKEFIGKLPHRRFLFRGQNTTKRLRTTFHRAGRAHIHRFIFEDVPALHRHLSARTKHVFNLKDNDENGAFYNLVQHHGYPTPLLDWTYSAYVAALFAYRTVTPEKAAAATPTEKVRIFVFDQHQWKKDWVPSPNFLVPPLHLSVLEFIAIENERMIPQQAASTLTNIDDIETYIKTRETIKKTQYLGAIDLEMRDRKRVMRELSSMGITAGSLFPGLDGACEELKERFFES